jgi:hypothetical protein
MESAHAYLACALPQRVLDPLAHLRRRLVTESQAEDLLSRDLSFFDKVSHPRGERARFPRPRASIYAVRPVTSAKRIGLLRVVCEGRVGFGCWRGVLRQ